MALDPCTSLKAGRTARIRRTLPTECGICAAGRDTMDSAYSRTVRGSTLPERLGGRAVSSTTSLARTSSSRRGTRRRAVREPQTCVDSKRQFKRVNHGREGPHDRGQPYCTSRAGLSHVYKFEECRGATSRMGADAQYGVAR